MGDNLFILLQTKLDTSKKSVDGINSQIASISSKLEHLNIKVDIDDKVLKDLNSKLNQVAKSAMGIDVKLDTKDAVKEAKKLNMELEKVSEVKVNGKIVEDIREYSDSMGSKLKEIVKLRGDEVDVIEQASFSLKKQREEEEFIARFKLNMLSKMNSIKDKKDVDVEVYDKLYDKISKVSVETENYKSVLKDIGVEYQVLNRESKSFNPMGNSKLTDQIDRWKTSMMSMMAVLKRDKNVDSNIFNNLVGDIVNVTAETKNVQAAMKMLTVQYQALNRESSKKKSNEKELEKESKAYQKLIFDMKEFNKLQNSRMDSLALKGVDTRQLDELRSKLKGLSADTPNVRQEMRALSNDITVLGRSVSQTSKTMEFLGRYFGIYEVINITKRAIRGAVESVREMDVALTELAKVSDLSGNSLKEFGNIASQMATDTGRTITEATNAVADFARAGYDVGSGEATMLGKNALILKNIGDGVESMDEATAVLISTMKGFNISANDSIEILDKINNTSNNTAVGFAQLADGIKRSSAIMNQSGTSIDETIAMLTAGFSILQDMPRVSTSLNTLALRIRSVKDAVGEVTIDGETIQVAKFKDEFEKLGISLMDSQGQIRDFYDIMKDLAAVFPTLDKNAKASFASIVGGARNGSTLLAVLQNWDEAEKALGASINSTGSALKENEIFIQSLQGRINLLVSAWKELSSQTLGSDFLKTIVDLGTAFLKLTTNMGGMIPMALSLGAAILGIKTAMQVTSGAGGMLTFLKGLNIDLLAATGSAVALKVALGGIGVGLAIGGVAYAINAIATSAEKTKEKVRELSDEITGLHSEKDNLNDLAKRFEELSQKQSLNSDEYQEWLDIQNEIHRILPSVNGYMDEQGNFIITQTTSMQELNTELNEYIRLKKEELKVESAKVADKSESEINNTQKRIDALKQYGELVEKLKNGEITKSQFDARLTPEISAVASGVSDWKAEINKLENDIRDSTKKIQDHIMNTIGAEETWYSVAEPMRAGIKKALSEMTKEEVMAMRDLAEQSSEEFIKVMSNNETAMTESNRLTELQKQNYDNLAEGFDAATEGAFGFTKVIEELDKGIVDTKESISIIDKAISDMSKNNVISADTLLDLVDRYPQLRDQLIKTEDGYRINEEALLDLRDMTIEEQRACIQGQIEKTQQVVDSTLQRIQSYSDELSAIQTLAEAQSALNNTRAASYGIRVDKEHGGFGGNKAPTKMTDEYDAQIKDLEKYIKGQEELNTLNDKLQNLEIVASGNYGSIGGSNKKSGENGGKSAAKEEAKNYAKYYSSLTDEKIDILMKESDRLADAEAMVKAKLDNAQLTGNDALAVQLQKDLVEFAKKQKDLTAKTAEELRKIGSEAVSELSGMKIAGYENFDFSNINDLDIAKITQNFDKAIDKSKDGVKANLEYQKAYFLDLVSVVQRIYQDELPDLSQSWWDNLNKQIKAEQETIELEIKVKTIIFEDSEKAKKQLQDQLSIMTDLGVGLKEQLDIRNQIANVQNDELGYLNDIIYTLERRLELETTSKAEQEAINKQLDSMRDKQASLLKDRISSIKEEAKLQAELKIYGSEGKSAWEEENNAEIDAIKDKIDAIKKANEEKAKEEEIQKRILEIQELELKLEELKKNKSVQTLKQNEDGTWDFMYEADIDEIERVQEQINDKKDDLEKIYEQERQNAIIEELERKIELLQEEAETRRLHYKKLEQDLFQTKANELLITQNENAKLREEEVLNMEGLLVITDEGLTNIQSKYEEKLKATLETVRDYMSQIRDEMADMGEGSSGSSGGKGPTYSNYGDSGKHYFQYPDGSIKVSRPDGTTSTVKPTDSNYDKTVNAMEDDNVKKRKKYKNGGITNRTGWHWLDGNVGNPERVLSAEQTKSFDRMIQYIPTFNTSMDKLLRNINGVNGSRGGGDIIIENINLPQVKNGTDFVKEMKNIANTLSHRAGMSLAK
ncbi:MAG: phage tail tape measure protein [Cellulosilyticaceae bacterium]